MAVQRTELPPPGPEPALLRPVRQPRSGQWQPPTPELTAKLSRLPVVIATVTALAWLINVPHQEALNVYLSVVWSLYVPIALIGIIGALRSRRIEASRFVGTVDAKVVFVLPTVARPDTVPALLRVVRSVLTHAPRHLRDYVVHVVVDEGSEGLAEIEELLGLHREVEILVVPCTYVTPKRAKHKGRANHYALEYRRRRGLARDDVYAYHLDDDTGIGPDTAASIAEFIANDDGTYDLAQGVLTFPHQLAASRLAVLADSIRPVDDLTRFQFFTGVLGMPLGGLHGEHLLVRASVEDRVGWDFGPTKVEDAYFGLRFATGGFGRSTFLNSFSYGASPQSVGDLVKQRRRWAGGLVSLLFDRSVPALRKLPLGYAVAVWTTGLLQHISLVLLVALLTGTPGTSPVTTWLVPVWSLGLGYLIWSYLEGLRVNLQASGRSDRYLPYALLVVPGVFVFALVEAWAAFLGVKDAITGNNDFTVISKLR